MTHSCIVPGCPNKVVARGMCDNHYRRWKRNGSPLVHKNKPWGCAKTVRADGYIYITVNGKQVMEHRYLMEQKLGRKLLSYEIVHHIDGNKQNNDLSNLAVMDGRAHSRLHGYQRSPEQMANMRAAKHETIKQED